MPDTLIKMKTGTIAKLEQKDGNGNPLVPIEEGTVYFAIDAENEYGQIVFDNASNQRIVMSTRAETADHALTATSAGIADSVMWDNIISKPSDFTPSSHIHGNIANNGTMSSNGLTWTNEDFLLFSDTSNGGKIERTIIPLATTSLVGMVQLSSVSSTTEETLAATPKGVWEAINTLDVITEDNTNTNKVWGTDDQGVPGWISSATAAPIFEDITLAVNGWDTTNNTYTVNTQNVSASSIQIVSLPDHTLASSDEMDALGAAKLVDGGQGDGYFILKALGDIPTIPIDVRVLYQYSSDSNVVSMQSAAASANAAAASAAQAAAFAKMQVQKITLSASDLSADSNNTTYPYKYEFTWTGVQEDDWVDGSGVSEMDWAVESKTNKIILHFAKALSASTAINVYWAACEVVSNSSQGGNTPSTPQYTVTYDANGGTVTPSSVNSGSASVILPTPTRATETFPVEFEFTCDDMYGYIDPQYTTITSTGYSEYSLKGWYTAATGGTLVGQPGDTIQLTQQNTPLFAQWTYSMEIDPIELPPITVYPGYRMAGWQAYDVGSDSWYVVGDSGDTYTSFYGSETLQALIDEDPGA